MTKSDLVKFIAGALVMLFAWLCVQVTENSQDRWTSKDQARFIEERFQPLEINLAVIRKTLSLAHVHETAQAIEELSGDHEH